MSGDGRRDGDGRRKDLRLVKPKERVEPRELDAVTDAMRVATTPEPLDALDHEALLALTLGDEVMDVGPSEAARAEQLAHALDGGDVDEELGALVELAGALQRAGAAAPVTGAAALAEEDHEALLALSLGDGAGRDAVGDAAWAEARRLRDALDGRGRHALADLAVSLRAAFGATALAEDDHEALLAIGLGIDTSVPLVARGTEAPLTELAAALFAARAPRALEPADGDTLVVLALGAEVASPAERQRAEALAVALDEGSQHPLRGTIEALRAARCDAELDQLSHERRLRRALEQALTGAQRELAPSGRGSGPDSRVRGQVGLLISAVVALAAGFALFFGSMRWLETRRGPVATIPTSVDSELITTRSTTELFDPLEKFPASGGESDRMAKIVSSRASDLRRNRFARWGVQ